MHPKNVHTVHIEMYLKSMIFIENWMKDHGHEEQKLPGFQDFSSKQMFWISFTQIYCSKWTDDGIFKLIASVQNFVIVYIYIIP